MCVCTCLLVCSSQADSSCVEMFLRVTTTPLGMLSTALKWSSYSSLAMLFTFCFVFSSFDFSFLPRFPVQPVTNSEPVNRKQRGLRLYTNTVFVHVYNKTNQHTFLKALLQCFSHLPHKHTKQLFFKTQPVYFFDSSNQFL